MMLQAVMLNVKDITTSHSKLRDNVFVGMRLQRPLNTKRGLMQNVVVLKVLEEHGETLSTRHVVMKHNLGMLKNLLY